MYSALILKDATGSTPYDFGVSQRARDRSQRFVLRARIRRKLGHAEDLLHLATFRSHVCFELLSSSVYVCILVNGGLGPRRFGGGTDEIKAAFGGVEQRAFFPLPLLLSGDPVFYVTKRRFRPKVSSDS